MPEVQAIQSFEHHGAKRHGDRFTVSQGVADQLQKKGLVIVAGAERPHQASGATSSASPVAPASPQTTSKPSANGGKPKKKKGAAGQ